MEISFTVIFGNAPLFAGMAMVAIIIMVVLKGNMLEIGTIA